MKWVRIENGIVIEITDIDPKERFVKEIEAQFFSCSEEVEQGWSCKNGAFSKPTPPKQQIITPSVDPNTADIWQALLSLSAQVEALKGGN